MKNEQTTQTTTENNNVYSTTIKTRFNAESEQRELMLNINYDNVEREQLIEKASKYDVVQFQRALRTSFESVDTFDAFHNDNNEWNVHTNNVGKKIVTPETQRAELLASLKTLSDDQRKMLLKELQQ